MLLADTGPLSPLRYDRKRGHRGGEDHSDGGSYPQRSRYREAARNQNDPHQSKNQNAFNPHCTSRLELVDRTLPP